MYRKNNQKLSNKIISKELGYIHPGNLVEASQQKQNKIKNVR